MSIYIKKIGIKNRMNGVSVMSINPIGRHLGRTLFVSFIASLVASVNISAQDTKNLQPKLLVGIMVDDLQSEYLSLLRDNFTQGGFNRLLNNGVVISNVDFGTPLDPAAATAMIFTGASPSVNGVPSAEIFDRSTLSGVSLFNDATVMGNYTTETYSPVALSVSTIADEVKIAGGGVTYAYSISPNPAQALVMAGHAGNCAFWLNDANSSWASSTYYKDTPSTLNNRNRIQPLRLRIDSMIWTPSKSKEEYVLLPEHITKYPFHHKFLQDGNSAMLAFKNSPKVNEEVTGFAIDNLNALSLGSHDGPDMLSISYTLEPYAYGKTQDVRYEIFDSYYRLDRNLADLFDAIDKNVGLENALIFLAATPPAQRVRREDEKWQIPYGEFSTRKAISLLNLYLIAKYGNGSWVEGFYNGQFFLNHNQASQSGQDISVIRHDAARFLEMMAGVTKAYSLDELIDCSTPTAEKYRQNISLQYAGDILLEVMPGWQIIDDFNTPVRTEKVERYTASTAPVYILAPGVEPQRIDAKVDAKSIAPTITRLLRIRSPNAADSPPISLE